jgi:DNA-binding CsgD family transcriptional regulator
VSWWRQTSTNEDAPVRPGTIRPPKERQVALLARDGMSNVEIGAQLFLSRHTVSYHRREVFSKFGINSRRELARALPRSESEPVPV